MISVEVIREPARLEQLTPEWNGLVHGLEDANPFQFPVWINTWWRHFGSGQLRVFAFRADGHLAGVIPCFLHPWKERRQLTLLGSGVTDFLDPPLASAAIPAILDRLERCLNEESDWEICDWQDLSPTSPLRELGKGRGLRVTYEDDTACTELALTGSFDQYWANRSKDLRRNLRRYRERAGEMGAIEFSVVAEPDRQLTEDLIRLHAERWQKRGESGIIETNNSAAFLRDAVPRLAQQGLLRYFVVRFRGEVVALLLALSFRDAMYSYLSAFDPSFEILGFGRTLLYEAIRYAFAEGRASWNFLRGDEHYKFSWGAHRVPRVRIRLERENSATRMAGAS